MATLRTGFGSGGDRMVWFGHTGYTITALTIELSRDRETGDTVELTYEIPEGDALRSVPEMDSGIDVLSSVALSKAVITPRVAGVASVKLTYTKPKVEEDEEDSEGGENGSEEGEGSGEDGEGEEGSSPARTVSFTTSFDVTVVDQPILTTMPTSHFHYVYILWDATTHTHFYVGHTSNLEARLKTHNAGHVPHTSKFTPWEIHSAIAVQTEEQASELEKYFKSHSGREWVIKHLGLPMSMTSLS